MSRKEFKLTAARYDALINLRGDPVMFLSGGAPMGRSRQEKANDLWDEIGEEMGFKSSTVAPLTSKGDRYFTAEET